MTLEEINEQFRYDFSMKEENAEKYIPYVIEHYKKQIENLSQEVSYNDRNMELSDEQNYFLRNTLEGIKRVRTRNACTEVSKMKKAELVSIVMKIFEYVDECSADL